MENRVMDYSFTIIEDGQVPLAGNFDTFSYAPVIAVVVVALIALALVAYAVWVSSHVRRVRNLNGRRDTVMSSFFFHPLRLIRTEAELEYEAVSELQQNIA